MTAPRGPANAAPTVAGRTMRGVGCASKAVASYRTPQLVEAGDVFAHFGFPEGPVVAALGAPIVDGVANAFAIEDFGEVIGGAAVFPRAGAGDEMNVAGCKLTINPGVRKIGDVVDGIVEIKIVVEHAAHEISHVVYAGHGEAALENTGMFKERIRGVISAERSAHGGDGDLRLAVVPDKWDDFLAQVGIKNGLHVAAMKGVRASIVKAEAVDGVDGIKFDAAGVNEFGERADHALAFEFEFVAGAGGKADDGRAVMAVGDDAEFEAQASRVPAMIFAIHSFALRRLSMPAERKWRNGLRGFATGGLQGTGMKVGYRTGASWMCRGTRSYRQVSR